MSVGSQPIPPRGSVQSGLAAGRGRLFHRPDDVTEPGRGGTKAPDATGEFGSRWYRRRRSAALAQEKSSEATTVMGYGYNDGGVWMWVFGGLMMIGVVVLIGLAVWAVVTRPLAGRVSGPPRRARPRPAANGPGRCWTSGTRAVR